MCEPRPNRRQVLLTLVAVTGAAVTVPLPADAYLHTWLGYFVPDSYLARMGDQSWQAINHELHPSRDAALQKRLETVGSAVVASSGSRQPEWTFTVFESNRMNAFALPGGKVGFYEGIFQAIEDDDQLAAVVGHEIAHINARHSAQRVGTQTATRLGLGAIDLLMHIGNVAFVEPIAAVLGLGVQYGIILPYSRSQELEADRLGLDYMARAGYRPAAAVQFWSNMAALAEAPDSSQFLSTHPSEAARIAALERLVPILQPIYEANRP